MAASAYQIEPVTELAGAEYGMPAMVVGNSPWRVGFPLAAWAGITIGCNGIIREDDIALDYLVTVDRGITKEAAEWQPWEKHGVKHVISQRSNWPGKVDVNEHTYYVSGDMLWQRLAGNLALGLALFMGCNPIVMVGFSMDGTNIYIGTKNYNPRLPGAGKRIPGADKRHEQAIGSRIEEMEADGTTVYWVSPGLQMLELLKRPSAKKKGK